MVEVEETWCDYAMDDQPYETVPEVPDGQFPKARLLYQKLEERYDKKGWRCCLSSSAGDTKCFCTCELLYKCSRMVVYVARPIGAAADHEREVKAIRSPIISHGTVRRPFKVVQPLLQEIVEWAEMFEEQPASESNRVFLEFLRRFTPRMSGSSAHSFAFAAFPNRCPAMCFRGLIYLLDNPTENNTRFEEEFQGLWLAPYVPRGKALGPEAILTRQKRKRQKAEAILAPPQAEPPQMKYYRGSYGKRIRNDVVMGYVGWAEEHSQTASGGKDINNLNRTDAEERAKCPKLPAYKDAYQYYVAAGGRLRQSAPATLRTKYVKQTNELFSQNQVLVASHTLARGDDHVVLQIRDKVSCTVQRENGGRVPLKHHCDVYSFPVAATVTDDLNSLFVTQWGYDGETSGFRPELRGVGPSDGFVKGKRAQTQLTLTKGLDDNGKLYHFSTLQQDNGLAWTLEQTVKDPSTPPGTAEVEQEYPAAWRFAREGLDSAIRRVLDDIVPPDATVRPDQYELSHDVSFLLDAMDIERSAIEMHHLSFSQQAVAEAADRSDCHLFVVLMPLEACGMWFRMLPEVATDENGAVLVVDDDGPPEVMDDGIWTLIPLGSMVIVPATLYHAGAIRTHFSGNKRVHFYVIAEAPGAGKVKDQERFQHQRNYLDAEENCSSIVIHPRVAGARNVRWLTKSVKQVHERIIY